MACESGAAVAAGSGAAAATSLVLLKRPPGSAILRFLDAAAGTVSFMGRPVVVVAEAATVEAWVRKYSINVRNCKI
jgi:hypothetical protein